MSKCRRSDAAQCSTWPHCPDAARERGDLALVDVHADDIGAELERPLEGRGQERVVDDDLRTGCLGGRADRRHVGDVERRVGGRLHPHDTSAGDGRDHCGRVGDVDKTHLEVALADMVVDEGAHAEVAERRQHQHLRRKREQRGRRSGHT